MKINALFGKGDGKVRREAASKHFCVLALSRCYLSSTIRLAAVKLDIACTQSACTVWLICRAAATHLLTWATSWKT